MRASAAVERLPDQAALELRVVAGQEPAAAGGAAAAALAFVLLRHGLCLRLSPSVPVGAARRGHPDALEPEKADSDISCQ